MSMRLTSPHQILRPRGPSQDHSQALLHGAESLFPQDFVVPEELPVGQETSHAHLSKIYLLSLRKMMHYQSAPW